MEDKLGGRGARWAEEGWWWETNGSNLGGGAVPTVQWEREMGVIRAVFKKVWNLKWLNLQHDSAETKGEGKVAHSAQISGLGMKLHRDW